jgi:small subunit ribosomal protein S24e
MDFEFIRDERNELLSRRELQFILRFEGATPSRRNILGKLCALQDLDESLVVLDSLKTSYGKQELKGTARIYDDQETLKQTEQDYLIKRSSAPEANEPEGEGVE